MNYTEAVFYIEQTQTPRERYGLEKLKQALELMGNPQEKVQFVHIAGTNGKGSTAAMLSSVLQQAGYRTGLYISPHLVRYNERMQINGENISDEDFIEAAQTVKSVCEQLGGTPIVFEVLTLMAFWYFAKKQCDIVVLEVGIGGRLDSTNVIPVPQAAVIAQLGLDHTETLGNTLAQIAAEKGGIIKPNGRAVMAVQSDEAMETVKSICARQNASLTFADPARMQVLSSSADGQKLLDREYGELFVPLAGAHQIKNTANVLETVTVLKQQGYHISEQNVKDGLAKTKWPGRFEKLCAKPDFILDGGHNPQCVQAATDALKLYYPNQKITFLVGMMVDKDTHAMLSQMTQIAKQFVCVGLDSPRAMSAEKLCEVLQQEYHAQAVSCQNLQQAVQTAFLLAEENDVICALGSLYLAGEIRFMMKSNKR